MEPEPPTASTAPDEPYDPLLAAGENEDVPGAFCPRCQRAPVRIQRFMSIISMLVVTRHAEYLAPVCRACATSVGSKELFKAGLLGWWGIPWGLLTLKAIWINARSLLRWSTIPGPAVALLALLCLSVPGWVVWAVISAQDPDAERVSETAARRYDNAMAQYERGEVDAAIETFESVRQLEPDSRVVNLTLADAYLTQGDLAAAGRAAARAEAIDPDHAHALSMNGLVLYLSGEREAAAERLEKLKRMPVDDPYVHAWMDLAYALEDWPEVIRASATLGDEDPYFEGLRLAAYARLEDDEGFAAAARALSEEDRGQPMVRLALDLNGIRTAPLDTVRRLTDLDREPYAGEVIETLVEVGSASGHFAEARAAYVAWLFAPDTPAERWSTARPWFEEGDWLPALDRYLADRPHPVPGLLALGDLDPITDRDRILALGEQLIGIESELRPWIEMQYFHLESLARPRETRAALLEVHTAEHPDHSGCLSLLAMLLADDAPDRAAALVADLTSRDLDPLTGGWVELTRAELAMLAGELESAEATLDAAAAALEFVALGDRLSLLRAEVLLRQGERGHAAEILDRVASSSQDAEDVAAALVLRWTMQLAAGAPLSYRQDVDAWLASFGASSAASLSSVTQGILLAEGRTDAERARQATGNHRVETFGLVRVIAEASAGALDRDALHALARSPHANDLGPRLARLVEDGLTR